MTPWCSAPEFCGAAVGRFENNWLKILIDGDEGAERCGFKIPSSGRIEEIVFADDNMIINGAQQLIQALNIFSAESLQGREMITVKTVSGWNETANLTCCAGDNLLKKPVGKERY